MMVEKVPDSTYDMIGGLDQQIKEIKEVIELGLNHPELFESLGIAQPKGVLLYGPPGTGKTLLARAVAHHADCKFIRVSGSELVQKYIGEGSRMVRELFVMAREHAPSIIFMDEIDSIGSSRVEGSSGGDSEVQRTMLELLNQLDGFEPTKNIKVIMATNRLDILDPALLRPGRIDRKIEFPPPTVEARADILKIHSRSMNLTRGIDLKKIAEKMNGTSGAELVRQSLVSPSDFDQHANKLTERCLHRSRHVRPPRTTSTRHAGGFRSRNRKSAEQGKRQRSVAEQAVEVNGVSIISGVKSPETAYRSPLPSRAATRTLGQRSDSSGRAGSSERLQLLGM